MRRSFSLLAIIIFASGCGLFLFAADEAKSDKAADKPVEKTANKTADKKPEVMETKPVPVAEAAGKMTVPEGFHVSLVAGEPDVVQPISFTFDDRGRMWVCECLSYPKWAEKGSDRITIFEKDKEGNFHKKKVFWDQGNYLTGIQLGFGGVWVCCAPNIYFIPTDFNGDDPKPTGEPQVVLNGWSTTGKHNVVNGLTWGPDGWLWGCNGITAPSNVGQPGCEEKDRTKISCGVWRYHPTRKEFEVVAHGTTNPWGLDFDDYGQAFITNCVIGHLFHVVPGGHYQRMFGADYNPYVYDYIKVCSDHLHWGGGAWTSSRSGQGVHSEAGGGHAHSGAMILLSDSWPDTYRNSIFMCNIHGNRVNNDTLERKGSGYVAHHAKDFLMANDPWFRGIVVQQGPDGAAYIADWSDTGECHNYDRVDRGTGRIYRVGFGPEKKGKAFDLSKLDEGMLIELQYEPNEWQVRHARRILQEHRVMTKLDALTEDILMGAYFNKKDVTQRLRAMWAVHAIGGDDGKWWLSETKDKEFAIRQWAVRFLVENKEPSDATLTEFLRMAKEDSSPAVRREIASALQRIPLEKRWEILEALLAHAEDATDQNLPLLYWYAVEPLVPNNTQKALALAAKSKIPLVREYIARRIAGETTKETKGN